MASAQQAPQKQTGEHPCCPKAVPAHSTEPITCACGGLTCPVHGHVCHPRWTLD